MMKLTSIFLQEAPHAIGEKEAFPQTDRVAVPVLSALFPALFADAGAGSLLRRADHASATSRCRLIVRLITGSAQSGTPTAGIAPCCRWAALVSWCCASSTRRPTTTCSPSATSWVRAYRDRHAPGSCSPICRTSVPFLSMTTARDRPAHLPRHHRPERRHRVSHHHTPEEAVHQRSVKGRSRRSCILLTRPTCR